MIACAPMTAILEDSMLPLVSHTRTALFFCLPQPHPRPHPSAGIIIAWVLVFLRHPPPLPPSGRGHKKTPLKPSYQRAGRCPGGKRDKGVQRLPRSTGGGRAGASPLQRGRGNPPKLCRFWKRCRGGRGGVTKTSRKPARVSGRLCSRLCWALLATRCSRLAARCWPLGWRGGSSLPA